MGMGRLAKSLVVGLGLGLVSAGCSGVGARSPSDGDEIASEDPAGDVDEMPAWSPAVRADARTVATLTRFGGIYMGVAGHPSEGVAALRRIMATPQSREALRWVLERGTSAGQLTALGGLYFVDQGRFQAAIARFAQRNESAPIVQDGCSPNAATARISSLIARPEALRLSGPDDDYGLRYAQKQAAGPKLVVHDFIGGGWPFLLSGRAQSST